MKRLLGLLMAVMMVLFSTTAFAANYWTKTWAQGEYTITLTPEDEAAIADLRQKMDEGSVGTSLRTSIDNYPLSKAFEDFLLGRRHRMYTTYDDIGYYSWVLAMPDETAVPQEKVFQLAVMAIHEQFDVSWDTLAEYYPEFQFKIAFSESDNSVAVWELIFCKYADNQTTSEVYYEVGIYAEDGSIWGVDASIPAG